MRTIIIDTNSILRFLLDDIPEQNAEVQKLFRQAKKTNLEIIVSEIVIFEINFILEKYYRFRKEEIIEKLGIIVSSNYLNIESRELFISALKLYRKNNISLVDCFLLVKAEIENAELFTFDDKMKAVKI